MKIKFLYISILAIFSIGFFFLGKYTHKSTSIDADNLVYEPELNAFEPFISNFCPFANTPDTQTCAHNLAELTIRESNILANKIIKTSTEDSSELSIYYNKYLREAIESTQKTRDGYINDFCKLDSLLSYGGTVMTTEAEACRYYYINQYLSLLKELDKIKMK